MAGLARQKFRSELRQHQAGVSLNLVWVNLARHLLEVDWSAAGSVIIVLYG